MSAPAKLTASDVVTAVRRRFGAEQDGFGPEWAALNELTSATARRRADLFIVRAWSSQPKGHERVLIEVKVSRSDLAHELAEPEKMAAMASFAHRAYFATPAGLVKDTDDLGPGVGLLEVSGSGTREVRKAVRRHNPEQLPNEMVVEVFRRAARAEARIRTAAGADPAAQVVALQAQLAAAQRAEQTAREASRRDRNRLTGWLGLVGDAGGIPCKCGATLKSSRERYNGSAHKDSSTCPNRWSEPDFDAFAVRLGLIVQGETLAA